MPNRVTIRRLELKPLHIPFKIAFRHAAAERTETSSVWVEAVSERGTVGYGESCPRPYVTAETPETASAFFARHERALCAGIEDLASIRSFMTRHAEDVEANPAAWCAIELALLDLLAKESDQTVEAFLSLPPLTGRFTYTAVLGDAGGSAFEAMAEQYAQRGFRDFKIKLSGDLDRDRGKIAVMRKLTRQTLRLRVDANNLWEDAAAATPFLLALDYPFFAVEEPIRPNQFSDLALIAERLSCKIVLDESFRSLSQLSLLHDAPAHFLINVRVSKMGGLLRSLPIVHAARAAGIGLIVGAQVGETSLLTRAALTLAQQAGDGLVAQEGAFGTFLLEHDVCDPPLMFGSAGVLESSRYPTLLAPGLGIANRPRGPS